MSETWRLDRLVLQGFKSFADRTLLDFPDPVTGIIGPNGSGKSNLVEAIRFVTGSRAQDLRGEELKALLFHGAKTRPPQGVAEVRLELSRGRERLVVERRIEGDRSQLRVNGRPTSAKALALHLAGTGLGRGGYAVVGQGEVGAVLESPEAQLLAHLEEAAGLRPVAEAVRLTEERLAQAAALVEEREKALKALKEEVEALAREADRAKRARELSLLRLRLKRSLLLARKEALAEEAQGIRSRLKALEAELQGLQEAMEALLSRKRGLLAEEEGLRHALEEAHLALKEREGLMGEAGSLRRVLQALDRPPPPEPGPEPPRPEEAPEALRARLRSLREEIRRKEAEVQRTEEARRRYEAERARYEERLAARLEALREREALRPEVEALEEEVARLAARLREREGLEARLKEVEAQRKGVAKERERLHRLVESGADLHEGPRRVRGLSGVLGVVADLLRPEPGLEQALEAALGPRLQWVLVEDEEAAKRAIAHLKRGGGGATFLPLTLLRPRPLPEPKPFPGLLGPARALARLRLPGLPEEAVLGVLFGDTLVFQDLDRALAYLRAGGGERLVTLEGEVVERTGAITGGRVRAGGEALSLRRRLDEAETEERALAREAQALRERLSAFPHPRALEEAKARLLSLRARLERPLPPEPKPPEPPEAHEAQGLEALREEAARLEALLQQAEAHARFLERKRAWEEWERLQEEAARVRARLAELEKALEATRPLAERARSLEEGARKLRQALKALAEEETRLLTRQNHLLAEREHLRLTLARREAAWEEVERELAELPELPRLEGTPRALQARLAQAEAELEALGPVNALAERALAEAEEKLKARQRELDEAVEALLRLEAEAKGVEAEHQKRLEEAFARFQEAFRRYGEALLGGRAEVRRTARGLGLVVTPAGKRTQDLRLLSLGEKTLGALAFLFALGELQGGLPIAVLDEVDAALDEANLLRFTRFLRSGRQFLLVTHQKRTMEACHALYGVTSEEGVSRVYAIRKEVVHDL